MNKISLHLEWSKKIIIILAMFVEQTFQLFEQTTNKATKITDNFTLFSTIQPKVKEFVQMGLVHRSEVRYISEYVKIKDIEQNEMIKKQVKTHVKALKNLYHSNIQRLMFLTST